ncbi:MAG: molybdopterin-binding protein, partial [Bacteroidales bacterium]|nr:molybdopterin-binding protein [Bacteroidales bacterium]
MDVSIIVIGDELLIGQVTDTNSGWIARHINPIGWKVKSVRTVADDAADIKKAIEQAFAESELILTTGGLGPTKDDITKETLRQIFGGEMIHDKATEANVLEVVEKRHLKINPLTAAQADVPSSCRVIQ